MQVDEPAVDRPTAADRPAIPAEASIQQSSDLSDTESPDRSIKIVTDKRAPTAKKTAAAKSARRSQMKPAARSKVPSESALLIAHAIEGGLSEREAEAMARDLIQKGTIGWPTRAASRRRSGVQETTYAESGSEKEEPAIAEAVSGAAAQKLPKRKPAKKAAVKASEATAAPAKRRTSQVVYAESESEESSSEEESEEDSGDGFEEDVPTIKGKGKSSRTNAVGTGKRVPKQAAAAKSPAKRTKESSSATGTTDSDVSDARFKGRVKKGKTKEVTSIRAPVARKKRSASASSGSSLPPLPNVPLSSQLGPKVWEFDMLEDTVFVTVPARRVADEEAPFDTEAAAADEDVPLFWWPAAIKNRNQNNLQVLLSLDKKKEILKFA